MWNVTEWLQDPNLRWVLSACTLLGLGSGVLGSFAYLRKQSLMGDALAHAALPGVCIAFMLTGVKSLVYFLIGASVAGLIATFGIGYITRNSRIKNDAALAIVLSVFFGLGVVMLTRIQHSGTGNQSGLDSFLFGQAAAMTGSDVVTMAIVSGGLLLACGLFYKEFKLVSFDPGFAKGMGFPVVFLDQFIMFLMLVAVVVGIQAVGVVLMAAMLITPAAAARYWTERLGIMVAIAGLFGAFSGFTGSWISAMDNKLPSGPLAVLAAAALFVASFLLAPRRGVAAKVLLQVRMRKSALEAKTKIGAAAAEGGHDA